MDQGMEAWQKLTGQQQAPDISQFWRPMFGQSLDVWTQILKQGVSSPDVLVQWKRFLDDSVEGWSKVLEQAMGTEAFAKTLGKQMEGFLNTAGPAKKAADQQVEATLAGLGLASRSQLIAVAQQLIQLEEKIEGVEDKLDAVLRRLDPAGGPR